MVAIKVVRGVWKAIWCDWQTRKSKEKWWETYFQVLIWGAMDVGSLSITWMAITIVVNQAATMTSAETVASNRTHQWQLLNL